MAEFNASLTNYDLFNGLYGTWTPGGDVTTEWEDTLSLESIFGIPVYGDDIEVTLTLTDIFERVETLTSTLSLSITTDGGLGYTDTLTLTDSFTPTELELTASWSDTLALNLGLGYYSDSALKRCTYSPNVTGGTIDETPPSYGTNATVDFVCADPATSISVRRPKLGDSTETTKTRVYRNAEQGDLIVYSDPQWPSTSIVTLDFEALSEVEATNFDTFLQDTAGKLITYTDYFNREWSGVILTPNAEFFHTARGCQYGTKIQFQQIEEL